MFILKTDGVSEAMSEKVRERELAVISTALCR